MKDIIEVALEWAERFAGIEAILVKDGFVPHVDKILDVVKEVWFDKRELASPIVIRNTAKGLQYWSPLFKDFELGVYANHHITAKIDGLAEYVVAAETTSSMDIHELNNEEMLIVGYFRPEGVTNYEARIRAGKKSPYLQLPWQPSEEKWTPKWNFWYGHAQFVEYYKEFYPDLTVEDLEELIDKAVQVDIRFKEVNQA